MPEPLRFYHGRKVSGVVLPSGGLIHHDNMEFVVEQLSWNTPGVPCNYFIVTLDANGKEINRTWFAPGMTINWLREDV